MLFFNLALFALGSAGLINGAAVSSNLAYGRDQETRSQEIQGRQNKQTPNQTCLAANALQTVSERTGQEAGTDGIKDGQSPSAT